MQGRKTLALLVAALVVFSSLALAACGGDDSTSGSAKTTKANAIDRAFATGMIPHHESAIQMAKLAKKNASREQITMLADDIIAAQAAEITQLKSIDDRLSAAGADVGDLGITDAAMGMHGDIDALASTAGFDRTFIDMMIPHHQGAIRMARIELAKGGDVALKKIATGIIAAQSREIEQMNNWRMDWYGAASPSGGIPVGDGTNSSDGSMGSMNHSG